MAIKQQRPIEAHNALGRDPSAVYLDVRTESEFAQGHAEGAINVPVLFFKFGGRTQLNEDFLTVVEKILPKNTKLVVGCKMGVRSQRACEILEAAGYTDLTNIVGGFGGERDVEGNVIVEGWHGEGLPVSRELGEGAYESLRRKAGL